MGKKNILSLFSLTLKSQQTLSQLNATLYIRNYVNILQISFASYTTQGHIIGAFLHLHISAVNLFPYYETKPQSFPYYITCLIKCIAKFDNPPPEKGGKHLYGLFYYHQCSTYINVDDKLSDFTDSADHINMIIISLNSHRCMEKYVTSRFSR